VCSRKVALPGGKLAVSSVVAVVVHSTGSSVAVVTASEHIFSAYEVAAIASEIEDTAFALASLAGSSVVA
jgi:hypothetical protein